MSTNPHIVDADQLRKLSGKHTAAAVRRWASQHGIRVVDGAEGPWTTIEAVNAAMGLTEASNDQAYSSDIV